MPANNEWSEATSGQGGAQAAHRLSAIKKTMSDTITENETRPILSSNVAVLALSALGVVFGDIGTSPLYTLKTVLAITGATPGPTAAMGALSLLLWTLIFVTSIKYVSFAMRIDNDGEGGILALMALLGVKIRHRPFIIALGLMGAALIYGDGAITPAISVLSALEGLHMVAPSFSPYVLPTAVGILIALFALQPYGTARIGKTFGPVMTLWFLTIGALGLWGVLRHPAVLAAINPLYGFHFLVSGGTKSFFVLGGVFLCVTGAEALYADMGHFGAKPIRLAWSGLVLPSLVLNYAGQTALVVTGVPVSDNIFFNLCPQSFMIPLVILATVATIIASQSIITGAFSMTRQAIQLGWLPRLQITQTSAEGYGQIYVGVVNWLLMCATVGLALGFGKSDNLACAYGIAVATTMLCTSILLFCAMREIWKWNLLLAGTVAGLFIIVDASFVAANMPKILEGGYIPLAVAMAIYGLMLIWHRGAEAVSTQIRSVIIPMDVFLAKLLENKIARVPGTAMFLTRAEQGAPPVMLWHVKKNRSLHEKLFILTVTSESHPWVKNAERMEVREVAPNIWRGTARYGYMETPDIPKMTKRAHALGCTISADDITYYVGHETIVRRTDRKGLPHWIVAIFAFMQRNALHVGDYFFLPQESVVEIGRQIGI